jgi:hypothetical protein
MFTKIHILKLILCILVYFCGFFHVRELCAQYSRGWNRYYYLHRFRSSCHRNVAFSLDELCFKYFGGLPFYILQAIPRSPLSFSQVALVSKCDVKIKVTLQSFTLKRLK